MNDTQLLIMTTVIGLFVTVMTARSTASTEQVKGLSMALASLRTEFEAKEKKHNQELRMWMRERDAYKAYIDILVRLMNTKGMDKFPTSEKRRLYYPSRLKQCQLIQQSQLPD